MDFLGLLWKVKIIRLIFTVNDMCKPTLIWFMAGDLEHCDLSYLMEARDDGRLVGRERLRDRERLMDLWMFIRMFALNMRIVHH
jgi:hypothetical protein